MFLDLLQGTVSENAEKYGPLIRKERYFLFGPKKNICAGLVGCYLLIYNSCKKEIRPSEFVNVMDYTAQILENRKDFAFEITAPGKKQFQVININMLSVNQNVQQGSGLSYLVTRNVIVIKYLFCLSTF